MSVIAAVTAVGAEGGCHPSLSPIIFSDQAFSHSFLRISSRCFGGQAKAEVFAEVEKHVLSDSMGSLDNFG